MSLNLKSSSGFLGTFRMLCRGPYNHRMMIPWIWEGSFCTFSAGQGVIIYTDKQVTKHVCNHFIQLFDRCLFFDAVLKNIRLIRRRATRWLVEIL